MVFSSGLGVLNGIKCCGGLCCFLLGSIDGDGGGERGDDVEGTGAGDEHGSLKIALSLVKFTCAVLHAPFGLSYFTILSVGSL